MKLFNRKTWPFYLCFLCFTFSSRGQERQDYTGDKKIGPYFGRAKYQYIVSDTDTLFDGNFLMQRSSLEALLEKEDASFLFKGEFEKGKANGPWQFQFGEFQSDSQTEVVDFEYRVLISGTQEEGRGNLVAGQPNGNWIYQVNQIEESEVQRLLFKSTFTFEKGIPQQNFQIENDSMLLVGRFLRNGLAHDEWSSYESDAIDDSESWYFDEGVLKSVKTVKGGISTKMEVFGDTISDYKRISLDDAYGKVVRATLLSNGISDNLTMGIADLLAQNEGYYEKMNGVLKELAPADMLPKTQVKVPYFELDENQKADLRALTTDFLIAQSIAEKLLKNSHLNIVRRSDAEVEYYYRLAKHISDNYLIPLGELSGYEKLGIIEYLDTSKLINALWPDGKPSTTITLVKGDTGKESSFSLPNAKAFNFEEGLKGVRQMATYAKLSLMEVKTALSDELMSEGRTQALGALEKELISMNEALITQVGNATEKLPIAYHKGLENILDLADSSLRNYASLKQSDEKLTFGASLKSCFAQLKFLISELEDLPVKKENFRLLYTDSIWNPFMANVMDEEVKKRITAAYFNILTPYFLERIETNLACDQVKHLKDEIIQANERMEELRKADTRKLERKLRKEKDPVEILRLFNDVATAKEK